MPPTGRLAIGTCGRTTIAGSVSITNTGSVHILSGNKTTGSATIKNNS
jgi:hypothetical protein